MLTPQPLVRKAGRGTNTPSGSCGYVYDNETELYYLQSRYYNPERGRFINADSLATTGQGLLGNNMFAYCNNNPVIHQDSSGRALETVFDIISLGASIAQVTVNPTDPWAWIGLIGDVADVAIPCVGGLGEAIRMLKAIDAIDDTVDAVRITQNTLAVISNTAYAISTGGDFVYSAFDGGNLEYVGITNSFDRRKSEWSSIREIEPFVDNVDRNTAHYVEQTVITLFGKGGPDGLSNIRNSIGVNDKRYAGYLEFFGQFLK